VVRRKSRRSKAEREAWDAHVDDTVRYMRKMCLRAINDLRDRRGYDVDPELRALIERSLELPPR
jgi:hypothetical protein